MPRLFQVSRFSSFLAWAETHMAQDLQGQQQEILPLMWKPLVAPNDSYRQLEDGSAEDSSEEELPVPPPRFQVLNPRRQAWTSKGAAEGWIRADFAGGPGRVAGGCQVATAKTGEGGEESG